MNEIIDLTLDIIEELGKNNSILAKKYTERLYALQSKKLKKDMQMLDFTREKL